MIHYKKSPREIADMRMAGKLLAQLFADLRKQVSIGVSEKELDVWVDAEIKRIGCVATYKTPEVNFPGAICISTNDEIVHAIPTEYVLRKGDVVSFDLVISYNDMKADSAFTMVVGEEPIGAKKHLLTTTERSLYAGIDAIKGETYTGTIGSAVENVLHGGKLGIVRELVGHGIGREMHEEPDVPNYGQRGTGTLLLPGDTIAIEPMATLGKDAIKQDRDGWSIATRDGSLAAHFEHTILVTDDGCEILTQL